MDRLSYWAFGGLLAGVLGGRAALSITPYMNRAGPRVTVDKEITVPNLFYCSNFSYCCPPMWSRGSWKSEVAVHRSTPARV
jgi:hypothetical protein